MKCPKCGAPAGPSAPDGDFRYKPPMSDAPRERDRIRKLALEPSEEIIRKVRIHAMHGISEIDVQLVLRAFAEEIGR